MAYLDKEAYERKADYATRKMIENSKNENLTEEQHDVLSELCAKRHEMHTCGLGMFNIEASEFDSLHEYFSLELNGKLFEVELPSISCNTEDWEDSDTFDEFNDFENDDERIKAWNNAVWEYYDNIEKLNSAIERYLTEIDKKYGTEYCPTGKSRIF